MSAVASGPELYALRPVAPADRPLIARWRAMPHVRAWWGEPGEAEPDDPRIARWIVSHRGAPFAFVQDYDVHGWAGHHFAHLPPASRGLDLYVGEPAMTGRGHGSALTRQHMRMLFAEGVSAIGVDPHPANARAIAAYRAAGFAVEGEATETAWGLALLMVARRPR